MVQDIIDGHIEPDPKVAVDVHEMYKKLYAHRAEFKDFPFIEERYKDRLDKLRVIIFRLRKWAKYDCEAIKKDLERFPLKQQNIRGEPHWEGSQAEAKLKEDVMNNLHIEKTYNELRETKKEYKQFSKVIFGKHVYQEVQLRKEFNKKKASYRRDHYGFEKGTKKEKGIEKEKGVEKEKPVTNKH
jgi:hypothetical protein